jgi:hypothetical protein
MQTRIGLDRCFGGEGVKGKNGGEEEGEAVHGRIWR